MCDNTTPGGAAASNPTNILAYESKSGQSATIQVVINTTHIYLKSLQPLNTSHFKEKALATTQFVISIFANGKLVYHVCTHHGLYIIMYILL
jgi:hypothetical protein